MEERVSSTSPRRNIGVLLGTQQKAFFTQRNEVRNSIRRIKYLELAFYSLSMDAERRIVQLNATPESIAG